MKPLREYESGHASDFARHQSAYNEPAYHMHGIEHIVTNSIVDLFCNNNMLTIAKKRIPQKSNISPNSQLPSMSLT
jgi:hypothetical protein